MINLLRLDAIGPCSALAPAAEMQGFFRKHGVAVRLVTVPGTEIPALSESNPVAHIGAPAAIMRASRGDDIKLIACFDTGRCSGCLVVARDITSPQHLRGRRLGARVKGAAMWIQTLLALRALGLDPRRDEIEIAEVGDPVVVVAALRAGRIDGAVVSRSHARQLSKNGFSVLLDLAPCNVFGAPDAFVATTAFLREHQSHVEAIVVALTETADFLQSPRQRAAALKCIGAIQNIREPDAVEEGLQELCSTIARRPHPCIARLNAVLDVMAGEVPSVRQVSLVDLIDESIVRVLDSNGLLASRPTGEGERHQTTNQSERP